MIPSGAKDGREAVRGAVAPAVDDEGEKTDGCTDESKGPGGDVRDQEVSTPVAVDVDHLADCDGGWDGVVRITGY